MLKHDLKCTTSLILGGQAQCDMSCKCLNSCKNFELTRVKGEFRIQSEAEMNTQGQAVQFLFMKLDKQSLYFLSDHIFKIKMNVYALSAVMMRFYGSDSKQ